MHNNNCDKNLIKQQDINQRSINDLIVPTALILISIPPLVLYKVIVFST